MEKGNQVAAVKDKQGNLCLTCGLASEIPKIPMYGPYNLKGLEPGKTYSWCT